MTISVDFAASEPHFVDHLAPIARESVARGLETPFFITEGVGDAPDRHPDLDFTLESPENGQKEGQLTVCAAYSDSRNSVERNRRVVLVEHGAGQSYGDRNPSYVGGTGREAMIGVLVPNGAAAERHQRFYRPGPPVEVVGSPRVDDLVRMYPKSSDLPLWGRSEPPLVVVSWHWECRALPETNSAFADIGEPVLLELLRLARLGWIRLAGHAHPRATLPQPAYEKLGIRQIESFNGVCEEADIYMVDNSSTLFEFAALDRPVIVMNSPQYRRRANHGLRFWDVANIGPNVWRRRDVAYAVAAAIEDGPARKATRWEAIEKVYGQLDGKAAVRAMDAIERFNERA